MDLLCIRCGEPWDIDHVLHEEPDGFKRKGGVIRQCPCCKGKEVEPNEKLRERAQIVQALGDVLGDDIDGMAAELEDLGLT